MELKSIRKLKMHDVPRAIKIVRKIKHTPEINDEMNSAQAGIEYILSLLENVDQVEKDIADFMASLIDDMTRKEWLALDLYQQVLYYKKLAEQENLVSFFQLALELTN